MDEINTETWEEFEKEIARIQAYRNKKKTQAKNGAAVSHVLFRGQANALWKLRTTLERYTAKIISVKQYDNYLESIKPAVETYTGRKWDLSDMDKYRSRSNGKWPGYPFMIYARHHGFPSPLLDWTLSPYIALFFSLSPECESDTAAVYAFIEAPEAVKIMRGKTTRIQGLV